MNSTPSIITRTFDHSKRTICEECAQLGEINMSSISTRIIQDVGRFCESYASDFLIGWDAVRKHLEPRPIDEPYRAIELFAIRRNGVDHDNFFMSRLRDEGRKGFFCCERTYRRVLALDIRIEPSDYPGGRPRVTCTLKNLTDEPWRMELGDWEENAA